MDLPTSSPPSHPPPLLLTIYLLLLLVSYNPSPIGVHKEDMFLQPDLEFYFHI